MRKWCEWTSVGERTSKLPDFFAALNHRGLAATEIRETIGKNISEMERLEHLMQAVNELKKMGKEDEKEDEKIKSKGINRRRTNIL